METQSTQTTQDGPPMAAWRKCFMILAMMVVSGLRLMVTFVVSKAEVCMRDPPCSTMYGDGGIGGPASAAEMLEVMEDLDNLLESMMRACTLYVNMNLEERHIRNAINVYKAIVRLVCLALDFGKTFQ